MKYLPALAILTIGSWTSSIADRKDIQLDNNRFSPSMITAQAGDTLVFTNGRGGPHNVQFAEDSISDAVHRLLDAAMPDRPKTAWSRNIQLAGPLLVLNGDTYKVIVPALPPGRYRFFCSPHVGGGMRGELIVVP